MKKFLTTKGTWVEIKNPSTTGKLFAQCKRIAYIQGVEVSIPLTTREFPDYPKPLPKPKKAKDKKEETRG